MTRASSLLSASLLAIPLAACEPHTSPATDPSTSRLDATAVNTSASAHAPVLGHLEMRGLRVTLLGGPDGPRYTVATDEDGVVAERLSEAELAARFPELHERLERGVARGNHAIALPTD